MLCHKCNRQIAAWPFMVTRRRSRHLSARAPHTAIKNPKTKVKFMHENCAHKEAVRMNQEKIAHEQRS